VPCGVSDRRYGVTSLADLGLTVSMPEIDMALRAEFEPLFGDTSGAQTVPNTKNFLPRRRNDRYQAVQRGGVRQ
jgi:lipoyl(octanoyl) transferase